jgi:hypothetical protein
MDGAIASSGLTAATAALKPSCQFRRAVQDGRIHIEKINWPFLSEFNGSPAEYNAGLRLAIERGWLWMHESRTYVKFAESEANLFA